MQWPVPSIGSFVLALALASCAPQSAGVETALELPLVSRGLALEQPTGRSYPQIEVLRDGSLLLNGASFAEPGREFRKALGALLDELPKVPEEDGREGRAWFVMRGMVDVPFVILAAADTPYAHVREVLNVLQYRGLMVWDLLLAVREGATARMSALHVHLYMDIGISCGPGAKLVTELDWFHGEQETGGALRIVRAESYHTGMQKDPPPVVIEAEPIRGGALEAWLREHPKGRGEITFESGAQTTWQDVVTLLDHCVTAEIESAGDFLLYPTLDVWFPERREPSVWDPAPDWED